VEIDPSLSEQSVEELFQNAPCGYLATLGDGTIIQANQTFLNQTGYTKEWLLSGKRFAELLTLPGRIYHDTHFGPLLQIQGLAKEVAFDLVRRDESPLSVLVNAVRKPVGTTAKLLTLITVFDSTDRRKYEQELLLARRKADEAVAAERVAREKAEGASRIKDEFLAMVSHELRTPLNAILGWTQIMQAEGGLSEDQVEGLSVIRRNAEVQSELIGDLMDMSRIISGKLRLSVQEVHLSEQIDAAIDTVRPAADAKGIRLQRVTDPQVIVAGDPGRLQQVFWNLLTNAVKFTPKGGSIRVVMQRVNSHVEISVIDSGQGMTTDFIAHAFERFRQSTSTETQKTSGLGLGLSIVKNLVEMHGGSIHASSDGPGKGSTFHVNLPVTVVRRSAGEERVHPQAALSTERLDHRDIMLKSVKVLVVDDQKDAREMVRRVLAAAGAEVTTAESADEALNLIEDFKPDVLISDIGMPGEDGYELIRKVRMLGGGVGAVRAIALTAFARLEDRTKAMLSSYQMHLSKPVDAHELVVTVASLIGR
jgi:PAS domain S-box-containing protein